MSEGNQRTDLVHEGIDCVLRVGVPQESDMVARRVALLEEVTLALPAYIETHGRPSHPDDLAAQHRMIGFRSSATGSIVPLEFTIGGALLQIMLPVAPSVNAVESFVAAAQQGFGLIQIPHYHAEVSLVQGRLVTIREDFPPSPTPVSLLYLFRLVDFSRHAVLLDAKDNT